MWSFTRTPTRSARAGRSGFDCEGIWPDEFQAVAVIGGIEDVGEAFQLTNHIDSAWWENEGVTRIGGETRSTSVGDVVVLNGEAFMVKGWASSPWRPPRRREEECREILVERRTGDCYKAAGRHVYDATLSGKAEGMVLVHGVVSGQGALGRPAHRPRMGRGRAALPGFRGLFWIVVDLSQGRNLVLPREHYYWVGQVEPEECWRYAPEEAMAFMAGSGHWGPWEDGEAHD